jgi:hypothetical protein
MKEYPSATEFLNQYGDLAEYANGFNTVERRFLKFFLVEFSEDRNIENLIITESIKTKLHKVWVSRVSALKSHERFSGMSKYMRYKTITELHEKAIY